MMTIAHGSTSSARTDCGYVQACNVETGDRINLQGRDLTVVDRHVLGAWGIQLDLVDDNNTPWTDYASAHEEYPLVNDD